MDSFKKFILEGIFSRTPKAIPQASDDDEQAAYQQGLQQLQKMIQDLALDQKFTRDDVARAFNTRGNHIYRMVQRLLHVNDPSGTSSQQDMQMLMQHALQWYDQAKQQMGGDAVARTGTGAFDWQHTKDLAARRVNDRSRRAAAKSGDQNVLRGPWDYEAKKKGRRG